MSIVADTLRPFWLNGINNVSGRHATSFKSWLAGGEYFFQGIDSDNNLAFTPVDHALMMKSIAHDINRMTMAAIETAHGIPNPNELQDSTAWPLIRCYYAAFFACHAICRIFSISVTQIDAAQSTEVNKVISSSGWSGAPAKINTELYKMQIDSKNKIFLISKLGKSSHEKTWSQFGEILESLEDKLLLNSRLGTTHDNQTVAMLLRDIRQIIQYDRFKKHSNWLSHIRNKLNYHHEYGAWYPHDNSSQYRNELNECIKNWKKDPFDIHKFDESHTITKFTKGCSLILSLMHEMIQELAKRNSENNSFLEHGAFDLLSKDHTN
ncbi:hypothetical protein SAMN05216326_14511 [Nitrosomonas marina]|uniref:Uncharacterized protein n=1 Tax=Nitrosomonas marina TaxID=917 RepID=A0A1I0FUH6_9PROT|nr:hypothetical protein [Nitrosomonas marina]SET61874.1 hypothetical protein SAMN05216326_14511 [Nitrosomonas marina]